MKKLAAFSIFLLSAVIFYLFTGCCLGMCCKDYVCPEDVKVQDRVIQLFPMQTGDVVRYVNDTGDTLTFICEGREFTIIRISNDEIEAECCGTYAVEDLHWTLETAEKDTFNIRTDNASSNSLACQIIINNSKISGYWHEQFSNPYHNKLDSIQLAGKTFYNVYPADQDKKIYLEPDSLGIVGFILDGKEWRLLE